MVITKPAAAAPWQWEARHRPHAREAEVRKHRVGTGRRVGAHVWRFTHAFTVTLCRTPQSASQGRGSCRGRTPVSRRADCDRSPRPPPWASGEAPSQVRPFAVAQGASQPAFLAGKLEKTYRPGPLSRGNTFMDFVKKCSGKNLGCSEQYRVWKCGDRTAGGGGGGGGGLPNASVGGLNPQRRAGWDCQFNALACIWGRRARGLCVRARAVVWKGKPDLGGQRPTSVLDALAKGRSGGSGAG